MIKRLELAVREMLERALDGRGVTLTQYTILSMVSDVDGMSSADISRRAGVSKQATNEMINVLEKLELIARTEDAGNRRILRIKLTPKGRLLLKRCDRLVERAEQAFLAKVSPARLTGLRRTIEILLP